MLQRRAVIGGVAVLAGSALSGCAAVREETSLRAVCDAGILAGSDGPVFRLTPQVSPGPQVVELVVPLRQATIRATDLDLVVVEDGDRRLYRIPVNAADEPVGEVQRYDTADVIEYAQSLGPVPQTGRYRLVALTDGGDVIDEVGIEFRCYRPIDEPTPEDG
jgi:hypothetical protein